MAKHTIFESSMMGSTYYAERIMDGVAKKDLDNGVVGYLADTPKEGFVYEFTEGTKEGAKLVIIDAPEVNPRRTMAENLNQDEFFNPAGTAFRVRVIKETDEFGITKEGFTADTADKVKVGAFVSVDATSGKFKVVDGEATEGIFVGVIVGERNMGTVVTTADGTLGELSPIYRIHVKSLANA